MLESNATRPRAVASVYHRLGVDVRFRGWRDTRRKPKPTDPAERERLVARLRRRAGPSADNMSRCEEDGTHAPLGRRLASLRAPMAVDRGAVPPPLPDAQRAAAQRAARGCCGVMHAVHLSEQGRLHAPRIIDEAIASVSALRRHMRPAYPTLLFANAAAVARFDARGALKLWDGYRTIQLPHALRRPRPSPPPSPYLYKLAAMLATEWDRTLFLDADITLLAPGLPHSLLQSSLALSDVAAPVVPGRHKMLGSTLAVTAPGAPLLCSCLMAYSRRALPWLLGAARNLSVLSAPSLLRQSDQEYLWLAWTTSFASSLRVLPLPEE